MATNESLTKLTQLKDIILTAQEAKRYVDGINAAIDARLQGLQAALDALVGSDDTTAVIDTFNEVIAFLNGIEGTTLDALLSALRQSVNTLAKTKQDVITDLTTIRSGAAAGATAYQLPASGIPKSDLTTTVQASLGAADTAYQKPSTGIPKTDMSGGVQTTLGKADSAYQKPGIGIPKSDMTATVQETLGKADADNAALTAAKGGYDTLALRLAAMDETDAEKYVKPGGGIPSSDLTTAIQQLLTAASTALQPADLNELNGKVAALESLIAEDADGIIDKFNEIVDFLAGIGDTDTLAGVIAGINEAIAAKYTKPSGGIPSTDLSEAVQDSLAKAKAAAPQSNTYTKSETDTLLQDKLEFDPDLDPTDAETLQEFNRVLTALYQALNDAQAVTAETLASKRLTDAATVNANNAADNASAKAAYAKEQGDYAKTQGQTATAAVDAATGTYPTLNDRLTAIEESGNITIEENSDPASLFDDDISE